MSEQESTPYNHLLSKHGVLITFNIAKKVSPAYLKTIQRKLKKIKNKRDVDKLLKTEILKSMKNEIESQKIPGLIIDKKNEQSESETTVSKPKLCSDNKLMAIHLLSNTFSKKIITKKLSIDETCYLILSILTSLGLTDENFRNFHKKYNKNYNSQDDDSNEDEDEDNTDEDPEL